MSAPNSRYISLPDEGSVDIPRDNEEHFYTDFYSDDPVLGVGHPSDQDPTLYQCFRHAGCLEISRSREIPDYRTTPSLTPALRQQQISSWEYSAYVMFCDIVNVAAIVTYISPACRFPRNTLAYYGFVEQVFGEFPGSRQDFNQAAGYDSERSLRVLYEYKKLPFNKIVKRLKTAGMSKQVAAEIASDFLRHTLRLYISQQGIEPSLEIITYVAGHRLVCRADLKLEDDFDAARLDLATRMADRLERLGFIVLGRPHSAAAETYQKIQRLRKNLQSQNRV